MSGHYDIDAVIIPPAETGVVLLTGAAELVTDAILDLDLEIDYFQQQVTQDRAGVTCVQVDLPDQSPEEVQRRVESALMKLVAETNELTGWVPSVSLAETSHDAERETSEIEDIETDAGRLLPSGDEIVSSLLRDIRHERSVYVDSQQFNAMPVEELSPEDLNSLSPRERATALHRASALAGCLIQASIVAVDQLIEDIAELRGQNEATAVSIDDTWVLSDLPPRFSDNYTTLFAQEFLVALVDVTSRLTKGWEPLACVAQELGLQVLLNRVEMVAETADVTLDDGWRSHVGGQRRRVFGQRVGDELAQPQFHSFDLNIQR